MKKLLSILVTLTLVLTMFVGCGKSSTTDKTGDTEEPMKVGFVYIGPVTDGGWTQAHDDGAK